MSAAAVRTNLHQLIDTVENTDLLQHFYEALYLLQQQPVRKEVTEELTSAQKIAWTSLYLKAQTDKLSLMMP